MQAQVSSLIVQQSRQALLAAAPLVPRVRAWRRALEPERRSSPSHNTPHLTNSLLRAPPVHAASVSPFWLTLYFLQQRRMPQVCQNASVAHSWLTCHRPPSHTTSRHRARCKLLLTCAPGTLPRVTGCHQCRRLSPPAFLVTAFQPPAHG